MTSDLFIAKIFIRRLPVLYAPKANVESLVRLLYSWFDKLVVVLPFLSQAELLGWSKNLSNGVETIYYKAMDAEYIKSHICGAYHRLFDGGHSPLDAWEKVKNASDTDKLSQEVIGYVSGMWKDATTKMGMPFTTFDKSQYDKIVDSINASTGIDKASDALSPK